MPPKNKALVSLLNRLAKQGHTQAQISGAIGVSPQFLNDVRHGRRPLTELVARRLGDEFGVDYRQLMSGQGKSSPRSRFLLPLFPHPIEGQPISHPKFDGSYMQVPDAGASKLTMEDKAYVLRFGNNDIERRLHKNDLVLMSQSRNENAQIAVVRSGKKCFLCRRKGSKWVRVANGQGLTGAPVVVGHCIGVMWSALISEINQENDS